MCKERTTKLTICNTDGSCFSIASLWHLPSLFSAFSARRSLWTFHWFCLALSIETWPSFGAALVVDICGNVWENGRTTPINFSSAPHFSLVFLIQRKSFLGLKTSLVFFTACCHILIALKFLFAQLHLAIYNASHCKYWRTNGWASVIMYSLILNTFTIKLINSINITTFSRLTEVRKIPFKVEVFHEISFIYLHCLLL